MTRLWDRFAIRAEVARKGQTLTALAKRAGLEPSACRVALRRSHGPGEVAIARFLNVAPEVLWPDRYRGYSSLTVSNAARPRRTSQKRMPPADVGAAE